MDPIEVGKKVAWGVVTGILTMAVVNNVPQVRRFVYGDKG